MLDQGTQGHECSIDCIQDTEGQDDAEVGGPENVRVGSSNRTDEDR